MIFTSCVEPNNDILVSRSQNRMKDVIDNVTAFYESKCDEYFDKVILTDCSVDSDVAQKLFKLIYEKIEHTGIICQHVKFSSGELENVRERGKGFSELLMLSKAIEQVPIVDQYVVKLSARYRPKSWTALLSEFKVNDQETCVRVTFSRMRKVALTYAFAIPASALREFDQKYRNCIDDRINRFIEHNFYAFLTEQGCSDIQRVYIQKYFNHITSGSTGKRPGILKSLTREIVYRL